MPPDREDFMKHAALSPLLTALSFFLADCGTSHHFLPPRPLEKGEMMVSFAWHIDLGKVHPHPIVPDGNFYFGTGHDYNLGLGLTIPAVSINHVTAVRYWQQGDGNYWSAFVHVNQLMGLNNNPYVELGGAYVSGDDHTNHTFCAGVGIGSGLAEPILDLRSRFVKPERHKQVLRVMPFAKYAVAGREFGMSVSYYHGINSVGLENLIETINAVNQPVLIISGSTVDSISTDTTYDRGFSSHLRIYLKDGDTVEFGRYFRCGTPMMMMFPLAPWMLPSWYPLFSDQDPATIYDIKSDSPFQEPEVYLDFGRIRERVERGEDLVFSPYAPETIERLRQRKASLRFFNDLSIGIAGIRYDMSDD